MKLTSNTTYNNLKTLKSFLNVDHKLTEIRLECIYLEIVIVLLNWISMVGEVNNLGKVVKCVTDFGVNGIREDHPNRD